MDNEDRFQLCMYLAASAESLKDEPKTYGPLRLLEVLGRIATFGGQANQDPFLLEIAEEVQEKKRLITVDTELFYEAVSELTVRFAAEGKRRATRHS